MQMARKDPDGAPPPCRARPARELRHFKRTTLTVILSALLAKPLLRGLARGASHAGPMMLDGADATEAGTVDVDSPADMVTYDAALLRILQALLSLVAVLTASAAAATTGSDSHTAKFWRGTALPCAAPAIVGASSLIERDTGPRRHAGAVQRGARGRQCIAVGAGVCARRAAAP
jgi:hypothetical protein